MRNCANDTQALFLEYVRRRKWRSAAWLRKRRNKERLALRRILCGIAAAEAMVLALQYGAAGVDLWKHMIYKEAYTDATQEGSGPKREWGFSVDIKEGVLKFWRSEVEEGLAEPR